MFNREVSKKSQFTIFVILGMVMLIVVFLMLFLVMSFATLDAEDRAREVLRDYFTTDPINYYVSSCLELSTYYAVQELAEQGGVNDSQASNLDHYIPLTIGGRDVNISYGLINYTEENLLCDRINITPPTYPSNHVRRVRKLIGDFNLECENKNYSGYLGFNNFTRLGSMDPSNLRSIDTFDMSIRGNRIPNRQESGSFEEQMQNLVLRNMDACVNFSTIEDMTGDVINRTEDPPSASFLRTGNDFTMRIEYPFEVKVEGRDPVVTSYAFEYDSSVRLLRIQRFILDLLYNDASLYNFNLSNPAFIESTSYFRDGFSVEVIEFLDDDDIDEVNGYKYDRVLNVTDNLSLVFGEPLSFYVAIQNRRPVLDLIKETTSDVPYDIVVFQGDDINISPMGYDPDSRGVNYSYSGWHETRLESFNFTTCPLDNGLSSENRPSGLSRCIDVTTFDNQDYYPLNWTSSQPFSDTNRVAEILNLSINDIGLRNVTISIKDKSGLMDWQTVHILIIDLPEINLNVTHPYPDVPENVLSIEDPFTFDASDSREPQVVQSDILNYTFELFQRENEDFTNSLFSGTNSDGTLDVPVSSYSIQTIKDLPLNKTLPSLLKLTVTFESEYYGIRDHYEEFEFEVVDCIPFENHDSPYPYPYNSTDNPFLSSHSCCVGDITNASTYELEGEEEECFADDYYGELNMLRDLAGDLQKNSSFEHYEDYEFTINPLFSTDNINHDNSVFSLVFERMCDGNRGNICAGDVSYKIKEVLSCYNYSTPAGQCMGPPKSPVNFNGNPQCVSYGRGNTFESTFNYDDNLCDDTPRCSSHPNQRGKYGDEGPGLAVATCDSQGGCTYPLDFKCDVSECGAECDDQNPINWTGYTCDYGCDLDSTCGFQEVEETPCAKNEGACFRDDFKNYGSACFFNVDCKSTGPEYTYVSCNNAPGDTKVVDDESICYYSSSNHNICSGNNCNLESVVLEEGQRCDPVLGPQSSS